MLPDKDHPVWKTTQLAFVVLGFGIYLIHLHTGGADVSDGVAVGAGGVGLKLAFQWFAKNILNG